MRRLSLVVPTVLLAAACSSPEPGPADLPDPVDASVQQRELVRLDMHDSLGGAKLEAVSDGPWTARRVARSDARNGARSGDDDSVELAETLALEAPAESGAIGIGGGGDGGDAAGAARGVVAGKPAARRRLKTAGGSAAPSPSSPPPTGATGVAHLGKLERDAEGGEYRGPAGEVPKADSNAPAKQLRAGKTDDNADFGAYLDFLATWVDRKDIRSLYQPTDVSDRRLLRVVDVTGRPVPGAVVSVIDELGDRVLWSGTTYGDGVVPYYPNLVADAALPVGAPLLVEAYVNDAGEGPRGVRIEWDGAGGELEIALTETVAPPDPIALDVCFVIDTTGSMSDEIASIKASLLRVTEKLRGMDREFDLRYSAVLYRDLGDDYVTATHPFTSDIEAFDSALRDVRAGGGGDTPESLNQALVQCVEGVEWRPGAAKVAFLVADAPPHMDYEDDVPYGESARAALSRGIRIHSVAASGLSNVGTLVFRQIAQLTRGKFVFIEYGSSAKSAESHGVEGKVESDNLEDILFEQIRDELAMFGRRDDG